MSSGPQDFENFILSLSEFINVTKLPGDTGLSSVNINSPLDQTDTIQAIIDYYAVHGGATLFFPKSDYYAKKIGLRNHVSIVSNWATFRPVKSTELDFFYVAEQGPIQRVIYRGFSVLGNSANPSQNGMNLTAKAQIIPDYTGGLWYSEIKDIRIRDFGGCGLKLYCNDGDSASGGDMANQFLRFVNVWIIRRSSTARCLEITGQLSQTKFEACQFDGDREELTGENVYINSLNTTNDQVVGPVMFDHCTFQKSYTAVRGNNANVVLSGCWFENLKYAVDTGTNSTFKVEDSHFANACRDGSGEGYGIRVGLAARLVQARNSVIGSFDNFIVKANGAVHKGISSGGGTYIYGSSPTNLPFKDTTETITVSSSTLNAYNHKVGFVAIPAGNTQLTTIVSNHFEGEELIIRVWASGDNTRTLTINNGGNIMLPNGAASIVLKQNDTITLVKQCPVGLDPHWIVIGFTGIRR
ncbi:hypothetical protein ACE3NQ_07720 [Paenibacillus terreus]|uniref:Pectate lyase superfamily protein domain-containing protein n=1 Tax=Paenibacillus terreus TaxID=1387834 RepID=A0ABV5B532_9BACL